MRLQKRKGNDVKAVFITPKGERAEAEMGEGDNLLSAGQAIGMPLEGTCEGQMACSTCHVIVAAEWFAKLTPASEEEEDMLDLAAGVEPTSRLACQIDMREELDGLEVRVPAVSHDMRLG